MRLLMLNILVLSFAQILSGQSFAIFQLVEDCKDWRCVIDLAGDRTLRLDRSIPWRLPLRNDPQLSSSYGYRMHPLEGGRRFHGGVDITAPFGSAVLAAGTGTVTTGYNPILGNFVKIDHLNGFVTTYGHLDRIFVSSGDRVVQAGLLGTVGMSGRTTGPHLHWSTHYRGGGTLDPLELRRVFMASF